MNAKETLEKIANALAIAKGDDKKEETTPVVEEKVEAPAPVQEAEAPKAEDKKEEAPEVVAEDVKTEVVETEEKVDEKIEEPVIEEPKEDPKVAKMQEQIDELQRMLEAAVKADTPKEVAETPEVEVKPLTHSPETKPNTNHKKIGGHGGDVMSRVYQYLS
jgi:hypothetical protein